VVPKKVDHQLRRAEIAEAVGRIARTRGLRDVSFREVAAEAGISVSLVQHYFGTKANLLIGALDIHSARLGAEILQRVEALGPQAGPLDRVRTVAASFLPVDAGTRDAMLLYHTFAAAALTDPNLRNADAFRNADALIELLTGLLTEARQAGEIANDVDAGMTAWTLLALVLGLSLGMLLEQTTLGDVEAVLNAYLNGLAS
jgi:AcrR family transcriptional regulator